jgi:hypothetical protein
MVREPMTARGEAGFRASHGEFNEIRGKSVALARRLVASALPASYISS